MKYVKFTITVLLIFITSVSEVWSQDYNSGYPLIRNVESILADSVTVDVVTNLTVGGKRDIYNTSFVILPTDSAAPTIQNVIDWTEDGRGGLLDEGTYNDISVNNNNVEFEYTAYNLLPETDYVIYLVTSQDWISVIETIEPTSISFSTPAPPIPPALEILTPADNSIDVLNTTSFVMKFDLPIQYNSSGDAKYIYIREEGQSIPIDTIVFVSGFAVFDDGSVYIQNDSSLVINPNNDLFYSTNYFLTVDSGAIESALSATPYGGFQDTTVWNFLTMAEVIPTVQTLSPLDDAIDVVITTDFTIDFNVNVQFNSTGVSKKLYLYEEGNPTAIETFSFISGICDRSSEVSISGTLVTIDPISDLTYSSGYYVIIENGAFESITTQSPYVGISDTTSWNFLTMAEVIPTVQTISPVDDMIDVDIATDFTIEFDVNVQYNSTGTSKRLYIYEEGNPTAIETFSFISGISDRSSEVSISGTQVTINPLIDLIYSTNYYVIIENGAFESVTTQSPYVGISDLTDWNFLTVADIPNVLEYNPTPDSIGVGINSNLILTFDKNIQFATGVHVIRIRQVSDGEIFQSYSVDGGSTDPNLSIADSILTIAHNDFDYSTSYYVTISNGAIESILGAAFEGFSASTDWAFTTEDLQPEVLSFNPSSGAIDIDVDYGVSVKFNTTIQFGSSLSVIRIRRISDDSIFRSYVVEGASTDPDLQITDSTLTIIHSDFETNTGYYITIGNGAIETTIGVPFNGVSDNSTWYFTTIVPVPVSTIDPVEGSIEVSIYKDIIVTYDQAVQNLDGTEITDSNVDNIITLETSGTPIPFDAVISADKTIVTISATSNLPGNSTIDFKIDPIENILGYEQLVGDSVSFSTDYFNIWEGDNSTSFSDPLNWSGDTYVNGYSVSISAGTINSPSITSNLNSANYVLLEPGAHLTIESGGVLTVKKEFVLESSNDPAVGNASLLNEGTLTMNPGAEVKIYQQTTSTDYTYHMSSPVSGATQSSIGCDGGVYEKIIDPYGWVRIGETDVMTPAKGYAVWGTDNSKWLFSGSINNSSSYTVNTYRTGSNYGWNLAGNPYPCAIDWDKIGRDSVNSTVYLWLNDSHAHGTYNSIGEQSVNLNTPDPSLIPSMHAFYIQVPIGSVDGSIIISDTSRYHNNGTYMKSGAVTNRPSIKLAGINGNIEDETLISFLPDASDKFDSFDSEKLMSAYSGVCNLFSTVLYDEEDKSLSINSMNAKNVVDTIIQLGFKVGKAGEYKIKVNSIKGFSNSAKIFLIDSDKGISYDLQEILEISFTTVSGLNNTRFQISIKDELSTIIKNDDVLDHNEIYTEEQFVVIKFPYKKSALVSVYNLMGKKIIDKQINSESIEKIYIKDPGLYLIKVKSNIGLITKKVLIK